MQFSDDNNNSVPAAKKPIRSRKNVTQFLYSSAFFRNTPHTTHFYTFNKTLNLCPKPLRNWTSFLFAMFNLINEFGRVPESSCRSEILPCIVIFTEKVRHLRSETRLNCPLVDGYRSGYMEGIDSGRRIPPAKAATQAHLVLFKGPRILITHQCFSCLQQARTASWPVPLSSA